MAVQNGTVVRCNISHLKKHVLTNRHHRYVFVSCAYKRTANACIRTLSAVNETKALKPNVKHKQHDTQALKPNVKNEQYETTTLTPHVKHKLNETKTLTPHVEDEQHAPHDFDVFTV